jgi:hypothetical protein
MKHWRGDKWVDGFTGCGPITIDSQPPDAPCLYCRMQFRDAKGVLGYELNSAPGPGQGLLEIIDAVNYIFSRPAQDLPLGVGTWKCDFETYTTSAHTDPPTTWFRGKMTVLQDATHD